MAATANKDLIADLRNALTEAKETMDGKKKLNKLDRLIEEFQTLPTC